MDISLRLMTKALCRAFYKDFVMDPALFADPSNYKPYVYDETNCDAYFDRYQAMGRVHLAVMLGEKAIGEVVLKHIDRERRCCTMGITMLCDTYKNKGYGTKAELLALEYAFETLGMDTVFADALLHNVRSQHVLEKVGFFEIHRNAAFVYFGCNKSCWKNPKNGG